MSANLNETDSYLLREQLLTYERFAHEARKNLIYDETVIMLVQRLGCKIYKDGNAWCCLYGKISKRVLADGVITHTNPHLISARNSWERKEEAMREILFRGKRVDNKEWVYGDLIHTRGGHPLICARHDFGSAVDGVEVDYNTVGQYTGLVDKNGKQLFDGDIVRVAEYDNMLIHEFKEDESRFEIFDIEEAKGGLKRSYTTAISWEEGAFVFSSNGEYNDTFLECLFGDMRRSYPIFEIEIVGNIYDNPELTKGGIK